MSFPSHPVLIQRKCPCPHVAAWYLRWALILCVWYLGKELGSHLKSGTTFFPSLKYQWNSSFSFVPPPHPPLNILGRGQRGAQRIETGMYRVGVGLAPLGLAGPDSAAVFFPYFRSEYFFNHNPKKVTVKLDLKNVRFTCLDYSLK